MEKPTTDTSIALLQQSIVNLTNAIARIEVTVNKIDESTRNYVTSDTLKADYVSKEVHQSLVDKFNYLQKLVYGTAAAVGIEALHLLTQFLTRK